MENAVMNHFVAGVDHIVKQPPHRNASQGFATSPGTTSPSSLIDEDLVSIYVPYLTRNS